ncbi:hypothetical protein PILCRDRAFT_693154 [Piloderma croceum F 1598]|uniref:Uncharacterized protein n=1 Tax=Piloderma croceum (strain F 1598) TaxID=765440 RepID=A0A0C3EQP5_PILCF|nr:hypothetical protein PILCRDRAFT_693154 [Piloderma croceum F 1598]
MCMTGPERWHPSEGTASSWIYIASLPHSSAHRTAVQKTIGRCKCIVYGVLFLK